jgi:putative peptidoglycan lipid II flippase
VIRPRTIGALGAPDPLPPVELPDPMPSVGAPVESFSDPMWQPPSTGSVPVVAAVVDAIELDPDVWTLDDDPAHDPADGTAHPTPVEPAGVGSSGDEPAGAGRRLLRANLLVASGTALSRLTGLVRTSLILVLLADTLSDAYVNANNTPNMIYELILGGILTAALVPLFTDDLERGDGQDGTSAIISFALVALAGVTLIAFVGGPLLILLFGTGSDPALRDDYVQVGIVLSLLFAPQVFFYGLMAVWSALLNAHNRFMAAAWAPVLNNLVAIATLIVAGSVIADTPDLATAIDDPTILWILGAGTTLGIALMALSLYPAVRRTGVRLRFRFQPKHPAVRRAIALSGWTLGYVIANQIAVVVIQILAEPGSGGTTRYQVAFQWFQLPHALLAVSIMVTFQPLLGRADSRGDRTEFNRQLLLGFRILGLLIIPAAVGYVALPKGLDARTFVATGELAQVLDVTGIIAGFAIGLPGFSTYLYALRGFYAMKDTRTPFFINCVENAINIVAAIAFVRWWGVVGLALAFGVAYNLAAVIAVVVLARRSPGFDLRGLAATWAKLVLAAAVMGGFVYGVVSLMAPASALGLLPTIGAGIGVGAVTYFASIYALQVPGISDLLARLPVLRRFA